MFGYVRIRSDTVCSDKDGRSELIRTQFRSGLDTFGSVRKKSVSERLAIHSSSSELHRNTVRIRSYDSGYVHTSPDTFVRLLLSLPHPSSFPVQVAAEALTSSQRLWSRRGGASVTWQSLLGKTMTCKSCPSGQSEAKEAMKERIEAVHSELKGVCRGSPTAVALEGSTAKRKGVCRGCSKT